MLVVLSILAAAASIPETAFQTRAQELFAGTSAPGMSCAIRYPDGRIESHAFGFADRESKSPLKITHRLLAGSTGKTFFAAAILQLVAENKVELDKPIKHYIGTKAWFEKLPNAGSLTLRNLMNHTSGIPEYVSEAEVVDLLKANPDKVFRHEELVEKYIVGKKPLFEAGKGWGYADANYVLAGFVVEHTLKIDLYKEINRRFLRPLKLGGTLASDRRELPGLAIGYSGPSSPFLPEGPVIDRGKFKLNPQFEWAGGGFASTPTDLARWAHALFGTELLGGEMLKQMLDGVPAKTGAGDRYGLGTMIETLGSGVCYGHEGWFPGYLTQMAWFPESKIAIAVQFNTDDGRALKRRTRYFIDELAKAAKP